MKRLGIAVLLVVIALPGVATAVAASSCVATGYSGLTAALVNPPKVSGEVDATGCDIGVYYDAGKGTIKGAEIHGALYFGVFVNGDVNEVKVDVLDSEIHDIGDTPFNGNQRGVAIYYRAFGAGSAAGRISGNSVHDYQKGGIVANGLGTDAHIQNNAVTGFGPVGFIAQNGIQVGYGASGSIMRNTVTGHSYTGTNWISGGILVVGGPGYDSPYTVGTQIVGNEVRDNDIGVYLSNYGPASTGYVPEEDTNVKVVNNTISSSGLTNGYFGGGLGYQAGISDVGRNDKLINNRISGPGYDPAANPGSYTVAIDADPDDFSPEAKIQANR